MRKVRLRAARITQPKLIAANNTNLPVVTWSTGDIERVSTRKVQRVRRRLTWRDVLFWGVLVLCVAIIVGSLAWMLLWLGSYAAM